MISSLWNILFFFFYLCLVGTVFQSIYTNFSVSMWMILLYFNLLSLFSKYNWNPILIYKLKKKKLKHGNKLDVYIL